MAMPSDNASAPAAVMVLPPARNPAYTTPTAMPSGMLWSVTARTIMVVRCRVLRGPSCWLAFRWRWGITRSSSRRKPMPPQNPTAAGKKAHLPSASACSMAGISRLHTDAATMTPAAKPVRLRWSRSPSARFMKKTQAAPSVVPRKGIAIP